MRRHLLSAPVANDLPELCALLTTCALPCSDLTAGHLRGFLICRDGARLLATAGLEPCGEALLLRLLAVAGSP